MSNSKHYQSLDKLTAGEEFEIKISLIVAMSQNRVIAGPMGNSSWNLPSDMKLFHDITYGKPIIMGRKTFDSIGGALHGRVNIVLTKSKGEFDGALTANSVNDAIKKAKYAAKEIQVDEIFIIGGAQIYQSMINLADKIIVTLVKGNFEGQLFFPEISDFVWEESNREKNLNRLIDSHPFDVITYHKRNHS